MVLLHQRLYLAHQFNYKHLCLKAAYAATEHVKGKVSAA